MSAIYRKFTNPVSGAEIWYFEVEVKQFTKQVYPDLNAAAFNGYDGMSPGPTIMVPRGTESIVRFINVANTPSSVHLHGSYSRAPWDGWAEDVTQPGEYKDYYYPNRQAARLLWYHDHAMHVVRGAPRGTLSHPHPGFASTGTYIPTLTDHSTPYLDG